MQALGAFRARSMRMDPKLEEIYDAIVKGDLPNIKHKVRQALDGGVDASALLNDGMIAAMRQVGRRFETGKYFVPEMLLSARTMKAGLAVLEPYLKKEDVPTIGKVVAGTVQGDLHDIGKNLVCMMLQGAGFEIQDLGTNVSPQRFADTVRNSQPDLVVMSALITTTMPAMKQTIEQLRQAGLRDKVKVLVGGAPITQEYADAIGADGYAPDASRAVRVAQELLAQLHSSPRETPSIVS
jgi:5-methyltetrahydrofolate--homocysteine methyltransferase